MSLRDRKTLDIITMGCSKNLVDTERLLKIFSDFGYVMRHNPEDVAADEVIINTCGFIGDAKEESINMILECCKAKQSGKVGKVSVMGCLSQRYADELPSEIPEVDRWYGKFDWKKIIEDITERNDSVSTEGRMVTTKPYAYIKISEGCNRFCAFCAIPYITGHHVSRPLEKITKEVKELVRQGIHEFNVIAQDLSSYGKDLYGVPTLARLVDEMAQIEGVKRIRLHYAYPSDFPYDLLPVMARHGNVCKYLDIALQHISDKVLSNMRRHISSHETLQLLERIRKEVPGIHIRTTLMVGFPGEGESEFEELLEFVRTQKFERMGAFAYCEEEDTFAAKHFKDFITEEVKQERLDQLMALQEQIALHHNESKIGRTFEILVDSVTPEHYIGRTEFDSPEVDPEVIIERKNCPVELETGDYCQVKITKALPFELFGEVVQNG